MSSRNGQLRHVHAAQALDDLGTGARLVAGGAFERRGGVHHTVARYVALRAAGRPPVAREHRVRSIDEYLDKIDELVVRSDSRVRADVVHERIAAMGFAGGEPITVRR